MSLLEMILSHVDSTLKRLMKLDGDSSVFRLTFSKSATDPGVVLFWKNFLKNVVASSIKFEMLSLGSSLN